VLLPQAAEDGLRKTRAAKDALLIARDRRTPEEIAAAKALWERQQVRRACTSPIHFPIQISEALGL
jgi:hypothetical protein